MFTAVTDQEPKDYLNVEEAVGHLLIIRPQKYQESGFITEFKPEGSDAVFCDIADLDAVDDAGQPGKVYRGNTFLQGYLKGTFKRYLGQTLIGMIYYGPREKGRKPPYKWQDLSTDPAVVQRGMQWMQTHQDFLVAISTVETPTPSGPPKYVPPTSGPYTQPDPHAAPASTLEQMRRMAQANGGEQGQTPF